MHKHNALTAALCQIRPCRDARSANAKRRHATALQCLKIERDGLAGIPNPIGLQGLQSVIAEAVRLNMSNLAAISTAAELTEPAASAVHKAIDAREAMLRAATEREIEPIGTAFYEWTSAALAAKGSSTATGIAAAARAVAVAELYAALDSLTAWNTGAAQQQAVTKILELTAAERTARPAGRVHPFAHELDTWAISRNNTATVQSVVRIVLRYDNPRRDTERS